MQCVSFEIRKIVRLTHLNSAIQMNNNKEA